ncbi:CAP domain-containing protein [Cyanobacteria bacterium FACHB-63]|nr:CAP domain-containing protein [Cyanobacteria bacterium FACHB-63]
MGIGCTALILATTGCKQIRERFPDFPILERPSSQPSTPPTPVQSTTTARIETAIYQQINQVRQQDGLSGLKNNNRLAAVARRYSKQMAEKNFFSHTSPDGTTPADRVRADRIFYIAVGENLFKGTNVAQPAPAAVEGWLDSPGHRENILRPIYAETGVGVWKKNNTYYITQLFLRQ